MGPGAHDPNQLVGREIGGYRLERMLGEGAASVVYLGTRVDPAPKLVERYGDLPVPLPDEAAIKVLLPPWRLSEAQREEFRGRFSLEARTLQRLRHDHIVTVYAYGEDPELHLLYMILPTYANGTLADKLASQQGPFPTAEAARILGQVADALDYAHGQGVIHRDIKPGNILLDEHDNAWLGDFGIARLVEQTRTGLTTTGQVLGTPEYMAPEQAQGEAGRSADLYSLGVVLYRMVTGSVPFEATTPVQLALLHLQEAPRLPRELRPDLPAAAEAVMLKDLAKKPENRFGSAKELSEAFSQGLQGQLPAGFVTPTFGPAPSRNTGSYPRIPLSEGGGYGMSLGARNALTQSGYGMSTPVTTAKRRRGAGCVTFMLALLLIGTSALLWVNYNGRGTTSVVIPSPSPSYTASVGSTPGNNPKKPTATRPGYHPTATNSSQKSSSPTPKNSPTFVPTLPPTAIPPSPTPVILSGNLVRQGGVSPGGTNNAIDENLSTDWIGGHGASSTITFSWSVPVTIDRIQVWDRSQNSPDNNQINLLGVSLSDGTTNNSIDMVSGGPRCANIILTYNHVVTSVTIYPWDSSGNNGFKEIEIWASTGQQSSTLTCSNNRSM